MRGRGRMERTDRDKRSFCSFIREVFVERSTPGEKGRVARRERRFHREGWEQCCFLDSLKKVNGCGTNNNKSIREE